MRDGSPVWANPDLSVTAFPAARGEIEVEPALAGISSGPPEELPVIHGPILAHICAKIEAMTVLLCSVDGVEPDCIWGSLTVTLGWRHRALTSYSQVATIETR